MVTVHTKEQFNRALENREREIICEGEVARLLINEQEKKERKRKNRKRLGIALAIGGILAAPFTAGTSLAGLAAGATIGAVTLSTAELAIICGTAVAITGIFKKAEIEIEYGPDGPRVKVKPTYK